MKKKSKFEKIMLSRRRKLDIINYRAEKLSRKEIEKERKKATEARTHYLQLESNLESTYKIMFESIKQLEVKARNRANRITRSTVEKCRAMLEDTRKIFLNAKSIIDESKDSSEKIVEVRKKIDGIFMEVTKPYGVIVNNEFKANKGLKQVESMMANLDNISRPAKKEDAIL